MATEAPMFGTDEILWYDNGKWGQCGYAIANPNGKTWTNNLTIGSCRIDERPFRLKIAAGRSRCPCA